MVRLAISKVHQFMKRAKKGFLESLYYEQRIAKVVALFGKNKIGQR